MTVIAKEAGRIAQHMREREREREREIENERVRSKEIWK